MSALAAAGNEVGGHTVDHVHLTTVSASKARQEICGDRDALLQHGLAVTDFAYPYGEFNQRRVDRAGVRLQQRAHDVLERLHLREAMHGVGPSRDPYATTIVAFGETQTLADIENNIATAETYGGWAQILIHGSATTAASRHVARGSECAARLAASARGAGNRCRDGSPGIGGPTQPPVDPSAGVPAMPTLTSATGSAGSVALQWSAPVSDGGSAITGYNVYRGTTSGGETLFSQVGNVTSYTDTSVTNGTTYYYEVSAVNGVGEGGLSGELSATAGATSVIASDVFDRMWPVASVVPMWGRRGVSLDQPDEGREW